MTAERGRIHYGNTPIAYTVLRSPRRRKTIEITLDPADGVLVAAPLGASCDQIAGAVQRRAGWIVREATAAILVPRPRAFVSGESLPYLGRQTRLFVEWRDIRQVEVRFRHWGFQIHAPARLPADARREAIQRAMVQWYRERAGARLAERVRYWAPRADCTPAGVLIRDQRQRWGSCGPDGTLRFNWRIIMAPPALIDYVVVHELIHLHLKNHSSSFWLEVAKLLPDYALRRARLRELGSSLTL